MFVDEAIITLRAGKGGNGIVSWRREKYIPNGGPFGGDGGDGGHIILRVSQNMNTLSDFRHRKTIRAEDGERGGTKVMTGKGGKNYIIDLPLGTLVSDAHNGEIYIDLKEGGMEYILCRGGRGGFGNAHFVASTRQAPNFAELGDVGEEKTVKLELKLVADVGIIGFPNAGKSTLIQSMTNVRPKIADYPFTTLIPNLGVMEHKGRALVLEDVPGLIPGASEGKGLGVQFLKHIERTRVLLHLLDGSLDLDTIEENYHMIRHELSTWSSDLAKKPELIILSKMDLVPSGEWKDRERSLSQHIYERTRKKVSVSAISAGAFLGLDHLKDSLLSLVPEEQIEEPEGDKSGVKTRIYDLTKTDTDPRNYTLTRETENTFIVQGKRLEEIVRMTDMRYRDAVHRVYDIMEKVGIIRKIEKMLEDTREDYRTSFFEGQNDEEAPSVKIASKVFPLENMLFRNSK